MERLKNLSPGAVSMKPNAAAALVLCAGWGCCCAGLSAGSRLRSAAIVLSAALVAAIGGLTLVEYAAGLDLGIDQRLFHEAAHSAGTAAPGRMAVATALAFVLSASALALLAMSRAAAEQVLASVVLLIAVSAVLGYIYGTDLTKPWGTTQVSAYTVALLTVLGFGLLSADGRRRSGGCSAR